MRKFFKHIIQEWYAYAALGLASCIVLLPLLVALIGSTHNDATIGAGRMPFWFGNNAFENYSRAWRMGTVYTGVPVWRLIFNSFVVAFVIAVGKVMLAIMSAYAIVFFRFPLRNLLFGIVLVTLMLPVEVRMFQTYKIASQFKLLNTYIGLVLPWVVSTTGLLLFRGCLQAFPRELLDAARMDGAGPIRCLYSVVLPMLRPHIAALFVVMFLYGWNQYLWPLLITTRPEMQTVPIGLVRMLGGPEAATEWGTVMASTMICLILPIIVVLVGQKYLVTLGEVSK
ncbi:MAG: ABC transporter permease subunit [Methanomassiliicoccales archaeon]|nr:ABC transporter permease subunit [Methanomassiliicoccales archaeon]